MEPKLCKVCGEPAEALSRSGRCADCRGSHTRCGGGIVHPSSPYMKDVRARWAVRLTGGMTLETIGELMGVTRERIRQVEKRALLRLLADPNNVEALRELLAAMRTRDGDKQWSSLRASNPNTRPSSPAPDEAPVALQRRGNYKTVRVDVAAPPEGEFSVHLFALVDEIERHVERIPIHIRTPRRTIHIRTPMNDDTPDPLPADVEPSPVVRISTEILDLLKPLEPHERVRVMRAVAIALSAEESEAA